MVGRLIYILLITASIFICGCRGAGYQTAEAGNWFIRQNAQFERHHANHVMESSQAARDYLQYMNRQQQIVSTSRSASCVCNCLLLINAAGPKFKEDYYETN